MAARWPVNGSTIDAVAQLALAWVRSRRQDIVRRTSGLVSASMLLTKSARVEISGHTDNVGNAKANKTLSEQRAQACRDYIVAKGIDKKRLEAVGFGAERPIALNDTDEGRQKNRGIEAKEL